MMTFIARKTATAARLAALLVLAAGAAAAHDFLFVTTTVFSTGSCSTIALDGSYEVTKDVASIHSDAVARYYRGYIYVINRLFADSIQILDPDNGFAVVREFSTGALSNPADVAFAAPDKMYVSRNGSNALWIMNPQTGAQTGSIDLSQFADADGLCEMYYMCLVGERLFVSVQRLDEDNFWLPVGDSYVAVIDVNTDALIDVDPAAPGVQAIALDNADPFSEIQLEPWSGTLYVGGVGEWGLLDGGVEVVDPAAMASAGSMFSESAAGGDILDVEVVGEHVAYCIIQNTAFDTELIMFDPSTGTKLQTIYAPGDNVIQDIDYGPTGELFLADRTPLNPGVRVYDGASGAEILSGPIDVGLPPFDLTFSVETQTGVDPPTTIASLGQNFPNPFNPSTTIPFSLDRGARVIVEIFDPSGERVAVLLDEYRPAGRHEVRWNGLTDGSRPAPSGVYFVRLRAGRFVDHEKLVLLK
jgi:hypothetical protein